MRVDLLRELFRFFLEWKLGQILCKTVCYLNERLYPMNDNQIFYLGSVRYCFVSNLLGTLTEL